jgi:hypothetical protein
VRYEEWKLYERAAVGAGHVCAEQMMDHVQGLVGNRALERCKQMSAVFQPIAPGDGFEFDADGLLDCNHESCLDFKSRQRRAELVNGQRIVAVHQQVPTPLAHSHNVRLMIEGQKGASAVEEPTLPVSAERFLTQPVRAQ